MAQPVVGTPVLITATGSVGRAGGDKALLGFNVNSTSSGTLVLNVNGVAVTGTITPAIGYYAFPMSCPGGLTVTVGATINVTFLVIEGAS
jgi:hypothetical protein